MADSMSRISEYRNRKPKNIVKYVTIEIYHPVAGMYRFVQNQFVDKTFTLEAGAPNNASEDVTFKAIAFKAESPSQSNEPSIESSVTIQRAGSGIGQVIRDLQSFASFSPVEYTWREYLSDDTNEPVITYYLYVSGINVSRDSFTIEATDRNTMTQGVLGKITPTRYPGVIDL